MGLEVFRQSVMCTEDGSALNLCSRLVSALLVGFTAERDGMPVERAEIKSAIELLNAIPANNDSTTLKQTLYDFYFEGEFSNSTAVYYSSESARLLQRCSVYDYLKKVRCSY